MNLGSNLGFNLGSKPEFEPGFKPGFKRGLESGFEPGLNPRLNLGLNLGWNLGSEPGFLGCCCSPPPPPPLSRTLGCSNLGSTRVGPDRPHHIGHTARSHTAAKHQEMLHLTVEVDAFAASKIASGQHDSSGCQIVRIKLQGRILCLAIVGPDQKCVPSCRGLLR